jgi:Cu/Ag efflux protein CusF
MKPLRYVLGLLLLGPLPGCHEPAAHETAAISGRYPLTGRVVAVAPERNALLIAHEPITGLMGAMTMEFSVDATALQAATKNARLTAQLVHDGDSWRLENVQFNPSASP